MQKYNFIKVTVAGIFILLVCAFITLYLFENNMRDINLTLNGKVYAARTINETVGDFIENNNIPFNEDYDYIDLPLEKSLEKETVNSFEIKTAVPVTLIYDGIEKQAMTYRESIIEVLADNGIVMYENDRIDMYEPTTRVAEGMVIRLVRVTKDVEVIRSPIPFKVKVVENPTMGANVSRTITEGAYGEHGLVSEITYEDGIEIARETILDEVIRPVVHEIIERGTIPFKKIQGTDEIFLYSKVVIMDATAYTLAPEECGGKEPGDPGYGITRSGLPAARGRIAVDPSVIPLFTKIYIETIDGKFLDYGMSIAADTGSGIKGNHVDLYMEDIAEALSWGWRKVRVYFVYDD
ncbi:MAG: G5 domain-containing protein [Clostridia bacterium]|nr:G5 domain-containing protein [Clostridia bacterium]